MAEESIKLAFVERSLDNYLKKVSAEMVGAIDKLDAKVTEDLRKSISGKTVKGGAQSDGVANLFFNEYGRMVDMGAGRSVKRTGKLSAKQKREANKLRKPKKFYSPIAYGNLNPLINELQYGLTDEVVAAIKKQFADVS
jgi:hypothetical protein